MVNTLKMCMDCSVLTLFQPLSLALSARAGTTQKAEKCHSVKLVSGQSWYQALGLIYI